MVGFSLFQCPSFEFATLTLSEIAVKIGKISVGSMSDFDSQSASGMKKIKDFLSLVAAPAGGFERSSDSFLVSG